MSRKPAILGLLLSFGLLGNVCFGKYSGGTGEPNDPYLIATPNDLNSIGLDPNDWDAHFLLTDDINLADYTGTQFNIIGTSDEAFAGVFDGNGHTISNFTYESNDISYVGLFVYVNDPNAIIKDLTLTDPNVNAAGYSNYVGSVVGNIFEGTISDCVVEGGSVSGYSGTGGLVGDNGGTISNCYATSNVLGRSYNTGGLVGENRWRGKISNCYATGSVSGHPGTGGLVGENSGDISNCYTTGSVSGHDCTGGLVGRNQKSTISNCYATGSVSGYDCTGGLAGGNYSATISNCYATGCVSGTTSTGGLVGSSSHTVLASFWDIETSDCNVSDGGVGLPTAEMQMRDTFTDAGWDFVGEVENGYEDIWRMCVDGVNYPKLSWEFSGYGDLSCPDGVDFTDYSVLANEWRLERLEQDHNSDGRVNFKDWAIFADNWEGSYTELPPFVACWLARSARIADIAPAGGDDFVNWQDIAILAAHWLEGAE